MKEWIWFLLTFVILYLLYDFLILRNKKALEKYKTSKEILLIKTMTHIDLEKINFKRFAHKVILLNCFIIAITISICLVVSDNLILILFLAMGILIPLILGSYYFLGKHYKRKERVTCTNTKK